MTGDPLLETLPEDVLREVLEAEPRRAPGRRRRKRYPTSRELAEVVVRAVALFYGHPDEFPDFVYKLLREDGFDTEYVTIKRIWRTYEALVRRGVVGDRLGVLAEARRGWR